MVELREKAWKLLERVGGGEGMSLGPVGGF